MVQAIKIPKLGLTMEEGTIIAWFAGDGERIEKGQRLYAIETEKIVSEIDSDASGYLQRVAQASDTFPVGGIVGYLCASAADARASQAPPAGGTPAHGTATPAPASAAPMPQPAPAPPLPQGPGQRRNVSPLARRLADERNLDLATLVASSPSGVIHKRDVDLASAAAMMPRAVAATVGRDDATRRPLAGTRRIIAQRMMRSLATTAQMTGFGSVDMGETVKWRAAAIKEEGRLGVRLTYTDFALKAAAAALRQVPEINAYIDGDEIVSWLSINIGLAVALDDGLVVPVISNVDRLSLTEIARERRRLVERARSGSLAREDVEGATFTLSNFGSYGGDMETPILNPPQSALLGIGAIEDQAVVRDGLIVIRPMMSISLTFDHRLIDGAVAGRFRARFKAILESPALWMATMV